MESVRRQKRILCTRFGDTATGFEPAWFCPLGLPNLPSANARSAAARDERNVPPVRFRSSDGPQMPHKSCGDERKPLETANRPTARVRRVCKPFPAISDAPGRTRTCDPRLRRPSLPRRMVRWVRGSRNAAPCLSASGGDDRGSARSRAPRPRESAGSAVPARRHNEAPAHGHTPRAPLDDMLSKYRSDHPMETRSRHTTSLSLWRARMGHRWARNSAAPLGEGR